MRISVFGLGYVGAVTAGCLARQGHTVVGVDVHPQKVESFNAGIPPVVEPGLEDLLRKLIELPSLWSIIKHRGVQMNITFGDVLPSPANPVDWNLEPFTSIYHFPWLLRLNGEPALNITLVTTSPSSPLLICGVVVGVLAEKIGDDETYMTFRLINARSPGK